MPHYDGVNESREVSATHLIQHQVIPLKCLQNSQELVVQPMRASHKSEGMRTLIKSHQ